MGHHRTTLPDGCWFTSWPSFHLGGHWVQHGASPEARRYFPNDTKLGGMAVGDIVSWVLSCHEHRPCEPLETAGVDLLA